MYGFVQEYEYKNKTQNTITDCKKLQIELDLYSVYIKLQESMINKHIQ